MFTPRTRSLARNLIVRTAISEGRPNPLVTREELDSQLFMHLADVFGQARAPSGGAPRDWGIEAAQSALNSGAA